MTNNDDMIQLLSDYQAWKAQSSQLDLLDYAGCVATPDLLFAFSALLWPELILHEGNYFLKSHFDAATYDQWMRQLGSPAEVQKVMNHIHISTIFQQQEVAPEVARAAAQRITEFWSLAFAGKGLIARAYGTDSSDLEITLFRSV